MKKRRRWGRRLAGGVVGVLCLATGMAQASFLVPQIHHPGVFLEKYATPLPIFAGSRVDGSGAPLTVSYREFRQNVLADTFYSGGGPLALPPLAFPYNQGTLLWGYDVAGAGPSYPGITIEAERGTPTTITYVNELPNPPELQPVLTIDQTIHWANPLQAPGPPLSRLELPPYAGPQPVVTHLHGGEVPSAFDGHGDQWYTSNGIHGAGYRTVAGAAPNAATFKYPNGQQATTLWIHDHSLGVTRINVYAGVAANYFLRDAPGAGFDDGVAGPGKLPTGNRELEFLIQDRMFDIVGNLLFPDGLPFFTPNPQHPFWNPEFLGDTIVVNGRSWPYVEVDPQRYRIRFVNGSNARFYNLSLAAGGIGKKTKPPTMWVIGSDGGLLDEPVPVSKLLIAPAERYDVILDFAGAAGTTFTLLNDAKAPFPFGSTADPQTVGQIAQFRVTNAAVVDTTYNPDPAAATYGGALRRNQAGYEPPIVALPGTPNGPPIDLTPGTGNVQRVRQLTLNEIPGPFGPLAAVLNNTRWGGMRDDGSPVVLNNNPADSAIVLDTGTVAAVTNYATEFPQVGSTEIIELINLTADAHPIHLHLVQFQVVSRQGFSVKSYEREYIRQFPGGAAANPNQAFFIPFYGPPLPYNTPNADGAIGGNPAIGPYLARSATPPAPQEQGWKDTVIVMPKEVTRIAVRWTPQQRPLDPADAGVSYYPFDPTLVGNDNTQGGIVADPDNPVGPGYMWHCHILDHEDNEMMRPYAPVLNGDNRMD